MKEQIEKLEVDLLRSITRSTDNGKIRLGDTARNLYEKGWRKQSEPISCVHENGVEWISVEDRLPYREGTYLVYTWKGHILMSNCFDYFLNGKLRFDNYTVTHWMPLPQPPEMKGGAK